MKSKIFSLKRQYFTRKVWTPKSEWKLFRPDRFLYHLNAGGTLDVNPENLYFKRISIAMQGIYGKDKGHAGVWANNQIKYLQHMWPICFDAMEFLNESEFLDLMYRYDIWRIDTSVIKNKWYLDPNLYNDIKYYGSKDLSDYLFTENTIPPHALKLFTASITEFGFHYNNKFSMRFNLIPVDEINQILENQKKRIKQNNRFIKMKSCTADH